MPTPPLIGVTTYLTQASWGACWTMPTALLPDAYPAHVRAAGALAVMLPPDPSPEAAARTVARLDGLVLAGGEDIDPGFYGQAPHPKAGAPSPERDAWELALLGAALEGGTPVLGVCRGMQLMNVAAGGTLCQHLPDTVGHEAHNPEVGVFARHTVTSVPGTRVGRVLPGSWQVATHHHQGVDRLGSGLTPAAYAEDGTVEALEYDLPGFAVGVQWHPEMAGELAVFRALVEAAGRG